MKEVINMTEVIIYIIGIIATTLSILIAKQVVPWLKDKRLYDAAIIAVHAAEALYGRYNGEQKFAAALESLKQKNYDIQSEKVIEAIRAAWKQLDQAMYLDGEKTAS